MPKVSYYTRDELRRLVQATDIGMLRAGLIPGDRIANLFYAGDLYMGFVLYSLCVQELSIPNVLLPISGNIASDSAAKHIVNLQATVIITNTTNITRVTSSMIEQGLVAERVRLILFAGEAFYSDLYPLVHKAFPNANVGPLQFSSVDAGVIGLPVQEAPPGSDGIDAVYVVNKPPIIVEILNDEWLSLNSSF